MSSTFTFKVPSDLTVINKLIEVLGVNLEEVEYNSSASLLRVTNPKITTESIESKINSLVTNKDVNADTNTKKDILTKTHDYTPEILGSTLLKLKQFHKEKLVLVECNIDYIQSTFCIKYYLKDNLKDQIVSILRTALKSKNTSDVSNDTANKVFLFGDPVLFLYNV